MKKLSKKASSKSAAFAKAGGSGQMSGKNNAGPQKPGTSASAGQKSSAPWAKGGGKKMAGFTPASPAKKM